MKNAPNSRSNLDRALQRFAGDSVRANGLRGQMANAIVAQMIGDGVVKGGSGLRFHYGERFTRVTMDLDTAWKTGLDVFLKLLKERLAAGWNGFSGEVKVLAPKGADAFTTALGATYSYTGSAGAFGKASANAVSNEALGLTGGVKYSAYLIVFDTATTTDDSNCYLTAIRDFTAYEGATDVASVKWGSLSCSTTIGAWSAVSDVPETTSGLLRLVGLAGLALRRRRV